MKASQVEEAQRLLDILKEMQEVRKSIFGGGSGGSGILVTFQPLDSRGCKVHLQGQPQSTNVVLRDNNSMLIRFFEEAEGNVRARLTKLGVEV